jgi:hypothetical protein
MFDIVDRSVKHFKLWNVSLCLSSLALFLGGIYLFSIKIQFLGVWEFRFLMCSQSYGFFSLSDTNTLDN